MAREIYSEKKDSNGFHVLKQLELEPDNPRDIIRGWGESFINMPDTIPFLEPDTVDELCTYLDFEENTVRVLKSYIPVVRNTPPLKAYIWHLYYRLLTPSFSFGTFPAEFYGFPLVKKYFPEHPGCTFLIAVLGAVLKARERYRCDGVSEEIIRDTLITALGHDRIGRKFHPGEVGFQPASFGWFRIYAEARLFQLGRFNFKLMETNPFGLVLRNRRDLRKVMLMEPGLKLNSRGYCLKEKDPWGNPICDPFAEQGFTSELEYLPDGWRGYPVDPRGFVLKEKVFFPADEWESILEPGDITIDMHIPGGGGMTPERCRDSFARAFEFFGSRYHGKHKAVIISHSWIFNTQFEDCLPDSNLAKLMRECYLFPHPSCGQDGVYFIFGKYFHREELAAVPRDNRLKKAMLDLAMSPEQLRCGGMLFFHEDLEDFGSGHYRKDFRL